MITPGPNGCVCGFNGDCNCPFVPSAASDATSLELDDDDLDDDRDGHGEDDGPDDIERDRCVLGDRCCCPHPFHGADECFDAEMAEAFMRTESVRSKQPGRQRTRRLWSKRGRR